MVKVSYFLLFTEKSYKSFKIVKILEKESNIKNALTKIRPCVNLSPPLVSSALTNFTTQVLYKITDYVLKHIIIMTI